MAAPPGPVLCDSPRTRDWTLCVTPTLSSCQKAGVSCSPASLSLHWYRGVAEKGEPRLSAAGPTPRRFPFPAWDLRCSRGVPVCGKGWRGSPSCGVLPQGTAASPTLRQGTCGLGGAAVPAGSRCRSTGKVCAGPPTAAERAGRLWCVGSQPRDLLFISHQCRL